MQNNEEWRFFLFPNRCPAVKGCITQNAIPQRGDSRDTSYKREAQLRFSTRVRSPCEFDSLTTLIPGFFPSDLQILRSSLIIISLFGDAARFRCGNSCSEFIFTVDRIAIVQ